MKLAIKVDAKTNIADVRDACMTLGMKLDGTESRQRYLSDGVYETEYFAIVSIPNESIGGKCESCGEYDPTTTLRKYPADPGDYSPREPFDEVWACDECHAFAMDGLVAQAERKAGWDPNP